MATHSDLRVLRTYRSPRSVNPDRAIAEIRSTVLLCAFCLLAHCAIAAAICNWAGVWR